MRYYVYEHFEPDTGEIVYVGMGSLGRAWSFADTGSGTRRGNRDPEHADWAYALCDLGTSPEDFVRITSFGLSREEALTRESDRIRELGYPRFNKLPGPHTKNRSQWGEGQPLRVQAERLREQGLSYQRIAETIGSSTMTVWRNLEGKTNADARR